MPVAFALFMYVYIYRKEKTKKQKAQNKPGNLLCQYNNIYICQLTYILKKKKKKKKPLDTIATVPVAFAHVFFLFNAKLLLDKMGS